MKTSAGIIAGIILAVSLLYALSMFPGLEYHSAYFGQAYKALHPESFPGDKYMPADSPSGGSSYYWLVRAVGDLWLDDRFSILLFFLLSVLALAGVDKTARALGIHQTQDRAALLALMAMGHRFRDNIANLVGNSDFYAGTFAGVAAIWLFALLLSEAKFWKLGLCMILLWSLTPRWAWFPILITLALLYQEWPASVQRRVNVVLLLLAGAGLTYYFRTRPSDGSHALLFDHLLKMENSEVHPFLDHPMGNLKYFLLTGLGMWVTPAAPIQARRIRTVAVLGALLWILGGLYLSYAPSWLKIPYLVPFAFNRALQWPQYLLFLSISVGLIQRMRAEGALRRTGPLLLLVTLYATFSLSKIAVVALLWMGALLIGMRLRRQPAGKISWIGISACIFLLATLSVYGRGALKRLPHLAFMIQHGVIGDNPGAKWVGVDEYIRTRTPPNAVILPIATRDYLWRPGVRFEGSLRTRTGRTMPLGSTWTVLFKYDLLKSLDLEAAHMENLILAWKRRDSIGVAEEFSYFGSIGYPFDYLVVENDEADWFKDGRLHYQVETVIGDFTIFRREQAPMGHRP